MSNSYRLAESDRATVSTQPQLQMPQVWARERRMQTVSWYIHAVSMWLIRVTFMLFYRALFWVDRAFRKVWWIVMALLFVQVCISLALLITICGNLKNFYDIRKGTSIRFSHTVPMLMWSRQEIATLPRFMIIHSRLRRLFVPSMSFPTFWVQSSPISAIINSTY